MNQQGSDDECAHPHTENEAHADGELRRRKIEWSWSFWSEHPESILLLFFAGIFASPLTEFMTRNTKVWSIGLATWLFAGAIIAFICKSINAPVAKRTDELPTPATLPVPATSKPSISRSNPGRTFECLQHVGNWKRGEIFTEYEFHLANPAPIPHPGQDAKIARDDYYEDVFARLIKLNTIRVVSV